MCTPNLVYKQQGQFRTIAIYATARRLKVGGGAGVNAGCTSDFISNIFCMYAHFFISVSRLHAGKGKTKKVKALPLQAWTDPAGSRRLRLPDFKTVGT
jgi:hypothetical protein